MPENTQELYLDGYVWPDRVAVYLRNDEWVDARSYIPESLHESVIEANEAWQVENTELREFISQLMAYINPTEHQDTCNRECPAYDKCAGSTFCEFPYWALKRARVLGIEVE